MSTVAALSILDPQLPPAEADADHLRHLLEKVPCCLFRVGLNGVLLAANDAALQELGAPNIAAALARPFTNWIVVEDRERWHEFLARVREHGSGDEECDLVDPDGARHPVLLKSLLLTEHPDGIESALLVVRNISGTRRLEEALQIHAGTRRALAEARERLEHELVENERLRRAIEERETENRRLLSERSQFDEQLNDLQSKLSGTAAERARLEELLEEQERHRKALVAAHRAEQARAEEIVTAATREIEQALKALAWRKT